MSEVSPQEAVAEGILEDLVTQFSRAFDCLRELVQNSIDAGTSHVEVWTEYIPGDGQSGTIALHVDDWGEGMNESIIDDQFTQLFASTKSEDLTKIGKFGIGFVSVFALRPAAVLVHTGRAGQSWEVLFDRERNFTKSRIDDPVDGTRMTLFLDGDAVRYGDVVREAEATLRRWCRHSDTEIRFEDRSAERFGRPRDVRVINAEFAVAGLCLTAVEHEGTSIRVAYADSPSFGFYNRGLTLYETRDPADAFGESEAGRFRHIRLKVKSRWLEHTLSRETVVRDEGFDKAFRLVRDAVRGPLLEALAQRLEALAGMRRWDLPAFEDYGRHLRMLSRLPLGDLRVVERRGILRVWGGGRESLLEAYRRARDEGYIFLSEDGGSGVARALRDQGVRVLVGRAADDPRVALSDTRGEGVLAPVSELLGRYFADTDYRVAHGPAVHPVRGLLFGRTPGADAARARARIAWPGSVFVSVSFDVDLPGGASDLLEAAARALETAGVRHRNLALGRFDAGDYAPLFAVGETVSPLMMRPPAGSSNSAAAIHVGHPHFERLLRLWAIAPALAAYGLAKALMLEQDRHLDRDARVMAAAQEAP